MERLYVVVRNDLDIAYAAVQAGHAVAAWLLANPNNSWQNRTLVYCTVQDEQRLSILSMKLDSKGYAHAKFFEEDMSNQLTALACLTQSNFFDNLKLLGAE
jgi:hypothetical protein